MKEIPEDEISSYLEPSKCVNLKHGEFLEELPLRHLDNIEYAVFASESIFVVGHLCSEQRYRPKKVPGYYILYPLNHVNAYVSVKGQKKYIKEGKCVVFKYNTPDSFISRYYEHNYRVGDGYQNSDNCDNIIIMNESPEDFRFILANINCEP